jgi:hypothetical protein
MIQTKIFKEDYEVYSRLNDIGVTKEELMPIIHTAVGAKADAVPHHPVTAPGTFSYHWGTMALRDVFVPKGWIKDSTEGIESVYDPKTGTKIIFQNADSACDVYHPKAISPKGLASERVILQPYLIPDMEENRQKRLNGPVWYFCFFAKGDDVRAELSRPLAIKGRQFSEFIERIFILKHGEWNLITPLTKKDDYPLFQEFDIPVTRK